MRQAPEQLPEDAVRIIHPTCGGVVCVTKLAACEGRLEAEAICYRCDRYVRLELKTSLAPDTVPHIYNLKEARTQTILLAWEKSGHNVSKTARLLGVSRSSVHGYLYECGLRGRATENGQAAS